ncbi:MAG: NrdJb, partial [Gammaproteobacteria bacterium]
PSIVAEIGSVVEEHLKFIGMIVDPELSDAQRAMIAEKRAAYESRAKKKSSEGDLAVDAGRDSADEAASQSGEGASFPPTATMCHKCSTKALVLMDGCQTCLNCGYSKCG